MKSNKFYIIVFSILIVLLIAGGGLFIFYKKYFPLSKLKANLSNEEVIDENGNNIVDSDTDISSKKTLNPQPEIIKAIYATSWSVSRESYINYMINIARTTEINAVVIDIKDYSGYVAYNTELPEVEKYGAEQIRISNVDSLIERLHQEGIYVIARISVFQDPVLARARPDLAVHSKFKLSSLGLGFFSSASLWLDNLELAWIDPAAKEAWDYNIAVSKDAASRGFDELNFDYVRFPSDGNLNDMVFPLWDEATPKHLVIKDFFAQLRKELPNVKLSIDLFGLTCSSYGDLGVGQVIEDAYEYFDYVCPMVYPSHYALGFLGYSNPAEHPYEVVRYSMESALKKRAIYNESQEKSSSVPPSKTSEDEEEEKREVQLRPWIQDFDLGADYNAGMVRAEIQAVYDALEDNFKGFMLWNSRNIYTTDALEPE